MVGMSFLTARRRVQRRPDEADEPINDAEMQASNLRAQLIAAIKSLARLSVSVSSTEMSLPVAFGFFCFVSFIALCVKMKHYLSTVR